MKIAALYVLYNPDWGYLINSIESIKDKVDYIFYYANSQIAYSDRKKLLSIKHQSKILGNENNNGIAVALNELCRNAISEGYKWAITMDQDSIMPSYFIDEYEKFIIDNNNNRIGIVCPNFTIGKNSEVEIKDMSMNLDKTITSGACMNLDVFKVVNGFRDDLFIDAVDTEYSWKIRLAGFKIIRLMWLVLEHHIGEHPFFITLFGKRILGVDNHNYLRCYYITRNTLLINREYKELLPKSVKNNRKAFKLFIKVLFFEKDKVRKIRSIFYGIIDYKKNKLGKYNH